MLAEASYWATWFPGELLAGLTILAIGYRGIETFVKVKLAMPTLLEAAAELKHNGGSSIKDDISAIKKEQSRVAQQLHQSTRITNTRLSRIEERVGIGAQE